MKKTDLVEVVQKMGHSKNIATDIVNAVFDSIVDSLVSGDKVAIAKIGTFAVKQREARKGRNPKTGVEMTIPARKAVSFKPASTLKEALNA